MAAPTVYQRRIRRAEELASQQAFAAEILGFYVQIARFQDELYRKLDGSAGVSPALSRAERPADGQRDAGATAAPELITAPDLMAGFPRFLNVVEDYGPARVAQVAHDLRVASSQARSDLLNTFWSSRQPPSDPEHFLAHAFLQPWAELLRSRAMLQLAGYSQSMCPFCDRKPALGVMRQQGDGASRNLVCGLCLTEWEFRRIVCPGCGEENYAKLPVYTAAELPHIRVECCDSCQTYIKSVDLTKNGLADPLVDELASVPLNLWAQERGYAKLQLNLLGM